MNEKLPEAPTYLEIMTRNRNVLRFCLERLMSELPTDRDWLDTDLEKQCNTALKICGGVT